MTASYPGDTNFTTSVSSVSSLVVAPATPTVTLTAPPTAVVGASVTLAVSVTGSGGTPSGTVIFKDGTTTLNTATLSSGAAGFSTSALAVGTHSITASYSGDSLFAAKVSAASTVIVNPAPAITFAALPTTLTITHGSSGTIVITGTPVGGYAGTVTFACGTLPTAASCTFAPSSLTFTATSTAANTTLNLSTQTTTAMLEQGPGNKAFGGIFVALLLLPLGCFQRRRLVRGGRAMLWSLLIVGFVSLAALTGCSSAKGPTTTTTTPGSYTVPVIVTAGTTTSTLNLAVTVQ